MPSKKATIGAKISTKASVSEIIAVKPDISPQEKRRKVLEMKKIKKSTSLRASIGLSDSIYYSDDSSEDSQPISDIRHIDDQRYIRIAVISREATHSFAKKYNSVAKRTTSFESNSSLSLSLSSSSSCDDSRKYFGMTESEKSLVDQHIKKTKSIPAAIDEKGFIESVQLQLEGKATPHVLTILEGHIAPAEMVINNHGKDHKFIKVQRFDGVNARNQIDHKQSMSAYIREDYLEYFNVSTLDIAVSQVGKKTSVTVGIDQYAILCPEEEVLLKHKCLIAKYAIDDQTYANVIVHIPNEYAKDPEAVNVAMRAVKEELKTKHDINMVGFHGDTNFLSLNSGGKAPTVNGSTKNGTVIKTSSGGGMTYFMQDNILEEYDDVKCAYGTALQNVVTTKNTGKAGAGVGIDHPSYMIWIEHDKPLESIDCPFVSDMAVDDEPPLPESKDKPSSLALSSSSDTLFYSYSTDGSDKEFNSDVMSVG
ncbi:MAG: hypothetical protein EP298_06090 [Gammaproteobacteria bacterium]|nr:MAG: hypothetical protein EP298_06090 [Gammaproteobacteria bacterium]UTW41471.1 hypothetical protein KFE69_08085 [bacterium SCSIO 12844]